MVDEPTNDMTDLAEIVQPVAAAMAPTAEEFDQSLKEASLKAKSLTQIIKDNNLAINIRGSQHIMVEAWITLARGYGCTAQIVEGSVKRIPGGPHAFEARAEVLQWTANGTVVIGAAEAECGTEGDGKWATGARPAFACRSMAQTRAVSKAIASVFRWVVVLAGYHGTPSDEMEHLMSLDEDEDINTLPSHIITKDSPPSRGAFTVEKATGPQKTYLKTLGYEGDMMNMTKTDASQAIKQLLPDQGR